ncbi:MAG TPA: poly-gamma-glutamate synthase PgsB [Dehalococcoidia bacterium]|nr:poly-gamma-glutamate synthase PgsB [Dehalococcoidia bacterium]
MLILIVVAGCIVAVLAFEYFWHQRARRRIPIRIHVNGIRGKSSVVRLIAAGLREGGIKTWAKVTGTLPNLVDDCGEDVPIIRGSASSIIEQRAVVAAAAGAGVKALVLECMALDPAFQRAEETLLRPTIGVITNVRPDHEEVFGASMLDVALALSNTVPRRGTLVITAGEGYGVLETVAGRKRTRLRMVETEGLPDSLVEGFSYIEHKDNVALALAVCEEVGVSRETAHAGMRKCEGDAGALRVFSLTREGKTLEFVSALAANDPESTAIVYRRVVVEGLPPAPVLVLANSRKDRPLRSLQLGRLLAEIPASRYLLSGNDSEAVMGEAVKAGVPRDSLEVIESDLPEEIVERIFGAAESRSIVFAMGNTAGPGLAVADYFRDMGVVAAAS